MQKNKKNIIGIIPARMSSSRFPGKPLALIHGIPLLGHVYHRAKMCETLDEVYIATPDREIEEYAGSIGAKCIIGRGDHRGASNIVGEVMLKIEEQTGQKNEIIVMLQGDEPMIMPEMIDMAIKPLQEDSSIEVSNLMAPIRSIEEHMDPNCPKVVVDKDNFALYFSREPIPSRKKWKGGDIPMFKQVCVIPFKRDFLEMFNEWEITPLEEIESIDMNRVLEHRHNIKMVYEEVETYPVDTDEDLKRVEEKMENDPLRKKYEI